MSTTVVPTHQDPISKLPPHKRPGAWGFFDDEYVENRPQRESTAQREPVPDVFQAGFADKSEDHLDPTPKLEITFNQPNEQSEDTQENFFSKSAGTLIEFNNVQIIENTTTQVEHQANDNRDSDRASMTFGKGHLPLPDAFGAAEAVMNKVDPLFNVATKAASEVTEVGDAIWDLFKQVGGAAEYKPKSADKKADKGKEQQKIQELKMRIREFQVQSQESKQMAKASEQNKIANTMARLNVSQQEIAMTVNKSNMNFEGSVTISNIFWVALNKVKQQAKRAVRMPNSGKGKGNGLTMNLSAQEGQSMVSSSGSIASAG